MDYYTKEEVDKLLQKLQHQTMENILKSLPFVVRSMVVSSSKRQELANKFYEMNKDLAENKSFFAEVMEQVEAKNPGDSFEIIMEKAAREARRRLSLNRPVDYQKPQRPTLEEIDRTINGVI